jgi:putative GTP pyrophosphokinase
MSRSQVDRLGERLKSGVIAEADLEQLDAHRRDAAAAYSAVVSAIRGLGLDTTGRPSKSTRSIVHKLNRETSRLSQMQDVAGCRVVVADIDEQENAIDAIKRRFPDAHVVDRREAPSHGYRAVHVVVRSLEVPIEVQVRTRSQHAWAELSEKLSDSNGVEVKYGGGPPNVRELLDTMSDTMKKVERVELTLRNLDRDAKLEEIRLAKTSPALSASARNVQAQVVELSVENVATRKDLLRSIEEFLRAS